MKIFMLIAAGLFASSALAADITLAWDAMPAGQSWTAVRAYEIVGTEYVRVGEVAGNITTLKLSNVAPGKHTYVVRSTNGQWESADSNQASTLPQPGSPGGLKVTVTIEVVQ